MLALWQDEHTLRSAHHIPKRQRIGPGDNEIGPILQNRPNSTKSGQAYEIGPTLHQCHACVYACIHVRMYMYAHIISYLLYIVVYRDSHIRDKHACCTLLDRPNTSSACALAKRPVAVHSDPTMSRWWKFSKRDLSWNPT